MRIDHVAAALSKTYKSSVVDTIQSLPQHQQVRFTCNVVTYSHHGICYRRSIVWCSEFWSMFTFYSNFTSWQMKCFRSFLSMCSCYLRSYFALLWSFSEGERRRILPLARYIFNHVFGKYKNFLTTGLMTGTLMWLQLNKSYSDVCKSTSIPPVSISELSSMCKVLDDQVKLFI